MKTVEVKTAELIGPALDWAVGKADGVPVDVFNGGIVYRSDQPGDTYGPCPIWNPSTDWSQSWPLINKHGRRIGLELRMDENSASFLQYGMRIGYTASHILIAAMRAIVAANLGDVVSVPAELLDK